MNADEITREPLERWERSPKKLYHGKGCIWACAVRLMEARDPDAPAHISQIGHRIGLPEREINDAIKNAARRTGWKPAEAKPKPKTAVYVADIGNNVIDSWSGGHGPAACEVPAHARVHTWPEDHPDCAECVTVAAWFETHTYDRYWLRWVEK